MNHFKAIAGSVRPGIAVKSPVNPKRNTVASICWKVKPIIDSVEYD